MDVVNKNWKYLKIIMISNIKQMKNIQFTVRSDCHIKKYLLSNRRNQLNVSWSTKLELQLISSSFNQLNMSFPMAGKHFSREKMLILQMILGGCVDDMYLYQETFLNHLLSSELHGKIWSSFIRLSHVGSAIF